MFTTPYAPPETASVVEVPSPPTISLGAPPSRSKGTINTKQDKERKPTAIMLLSDATPKDVPPTQFLTLYPTSKSTAIEWRDGLRFLTGVSAGIETDEFTRRLADLGVRVKLLDIVAGGADIPTTKPLIDGVSTSPGTGGKVSITGEFWYDSMVD